MQEAKYFIHRQYYIFEDGELAEGLFGLFEQKVKEGVLIRILYDGIGSRSLSKKYIKKLRKAGVEIYSFLLVRFGKFLSSVNYRNHRKIIVVDNKIAFTGGINVSDKYVKGDPDLGIWHDMHLQLEGPIVHSLQAIFVMDWYLVNNDEKILSSLYFTTYKKMGTMTALCIVVRMRTFLLRNSYIFL
ncbi:phospholipase D-like domain-containing protein [Aquimarina sp. M1]